MADGSVANVATSAVHGSAEDARTYFAHMRVELGLASGVDEALAQVDQIMQQSQVRRARIESKIQGWDKPLDVFENFREYMLLQELSEASITASWDVFVERGIIKPIPLPLESHS